MKQGESPFAKKVEDLIETKIKSSTISAEDKVPYQGALVILKKNAN
jgi:hypothetical protein